MNRKYYTETAPIRSQRHAANKRKKKTAAIMFFIFLCIFAFSSFKLVSYFLDSKAQENAFQELEQSVQDIRENAYALPAADESSPQILPEYADLYEQNSDFWGWIKIDDTSLSYPVMYTPEDPEYYLSINFDGGDSKSGVPFLDGKCAYNCGNYIIYGHNMKSGKMFAPIVNYKDESFCKEHPIILLDTLYEHSSYSVIAAFYSKAYSSEDTDVFRYYQYTDLTNPQTFDEYIKQVKDAALYETDTDVKFGDQLLTLSTCSYHTDDGRFVVVAKKN